jgi:hypothetical protein
MKKFLANEDDNFYLEIAPFEKDREPSITDIENAANFLKIPLHEYVYTPFQKNESGKIIKTQIKIPVGYLHIKRMQQILSKKNSVSEGISKRSGKTGTVVGEDKAGRFTDMELYAFTALEADNIIKEFMSFRADDEVMKLDALRNISRDGYVEMNDLHSDVKNKQAINTLDVYFLGSGLKSDIVTPGMMLRRTVDSVKERESSAKKYSDKID